MVMKRWYLAVVAQRMRKISFHFSIVLFTISSWGCFIFVRILRDHYFSMDIYYWNKCWFWFTVIAKAKLNQLFNTVKLLS